MNTWYDISFIAIISRPSWDTSRITTAIDTITACTCATTFFGTVLSEESMWTTWSQNEKIQPDRKMRRFNDFICFLHLPIYLSIYLSNVENEHENTMIYEKCCRTGFTEQYRNIESYNVRGQIKFNDVFRYLFW